MKNKLNLHKKTIQMHLRNIDKHIKKKDNFSFKIQNSNFNDKSEKKELQLLSQDQNLSQLSSESDSQQLQSPHQTNQNIRCLNNLRSSSHQNNFQLKLFALDKKNTKVQFSQIQLLPDALINSFVQINQICCICLQTWIVKQRCKILPCAHKFHRQCIKDWLIKKNQCPICKLCVFSNNIKN